MKYTLDEWWVGLPVSEKERIASKLFRKDTSYPACTNRWLSLSEDKKQKIHDHVTDKHGHVKVEFDEGTTYSY